MTAVLAVPKLTIETNGLIDLELSSRYAADLREIVGRHGKGVSVAIPAIAASVTTKGGGFERDSGEFKNAYSRWGSIISKCSCLLASGT